MVILLIDDNVRLSEAMRQVLEPTYAVQQAFDGEEGYFFAKEGIYDLIVLDLMLPNMGGYEVLERLRAEGVDTPVLILTALRGIDDRIRGFRSGADDYLTKPFAKDELLLRIEAILRRTMSSFVRREFTFKELTLYPDSRTASIGGEELELRGRQYDVLEFLVSRQGQLISKTQIFDKVWGFMSDTFPNVVEVYVSAVRKQLKPFGYDRYLQTIRGAGYLFGGDDA
ncbi:response regulator transcription factor [Curtanaerobium respiraculi]|uniref:response regulator transcription factor n=1 Tax=Curtanaerobium respiraculi TaxID=2949669 RepID=UPI0024B3A461|nr:response regulator transcription factor [Curtanaerobium respiraculi]